MTTDDWLKLLGIGAGVGTSLYGGHVASNAANTQNQNVKQSQDQLLQLAAQERAHRGALEQMFMPSMLRDMGMSGGQRSGMLGSLFQQAGGGGSMAGQQQPQQVPQASMNQGTTQDPNSSPGLFDDEWMRQFGPRGQQTGGGPNTGLT